MEGVVSVFPSGKKKLHTTRSWSYVGLPENSAARRPSIESEIVVGVIDSGIWPESQSFNDSGFGPPPSKWKGKCSNFTCNKRNLPTKRSVQSRKLENLYRVQILQNRSNTALRQVAESRHLGLRLLVRLKRESGEQRTNRRRIQHLHTTHTPSFLGLSAESGLRINSGYGDGVIIGVLDTGIWPQHPSFLDHGFSDDVPSKWRGACEISKDFPAKACNRKLIGARTFYKGYESYRGRPIDESLESKSPKDTEGHGTHTAKKKAMHKSTTTDDKKLQGTLKRIGVNTIPAIEEVNIFKDDLVIQFVNPKVQASIAANTWVITGSPQTRSGHGTHTASTASGSPVPNASMETLGQGTARGAVPSSRIAVYKVCWSDGCYDEDILAAFDDAIADGVDVISISVGATQDSVDYFNDTIAIGAYHAMKKGILTSASAGNDGPTAGTVHYAAPWIMTVGASTTETKYVTKVRLGNGESFVGTSVNTVDLGNKMYPIIYGGNAPNLTGNINGSESKWCFRDTLDTTLVRGKIVLCDAVSSGGGASTAGAVGSITQTTDPSYLTVSYNFPVPTSCLLGANLSSYSIEVKAGEAPLVPYFSSRGPNHLTRDILKLAYVLSHMKPDIAAPGVNILAAWSEATTATGEEGDRRVVPYNILYGTSMACPHVTGAAAYIKSFHPTWSPAAIRSALMTTATPMSPGNNPEAELAYGAGLINLTRCNDPGLVYDAGDQDYIKFLCGQGYTFAQIKLTTGQDDVNCSSVGKTLVWELNYPSFTLSGEAETNVTRVFLRRVTNVGAEVSNYKAMISTSSKELEIKVDPEVLSFSSVGEPKEFRVSVTAMLMNKASGVVLSGVLVWSDGSHQINVVNAIRSPLEGVVGLVVRDNTSVILFAIESAILNRVSEKRDRERERERETEAFMDAGVGANYNPRTVEEVFRDFKGRRAGLIKALTSDVDEFYQHCDPEKENLCLYGFPNERWEVALPAEEVPPELPEPALGINFARDGMQERDWLSLVAVHSDAWLLSVAFYFGARFGFDKADRKRLFNMINDLPTVFEAVSGPAKKQSKEKSSVSNNSSNKSKSNSKGREHQVKYAKLEHEDEVLDDEEEEDGEEDDEHGDTLCGACGDNYGADEFWICCDICEKWFHGKCVKITPARAEHIKQYKCPSCSSNKRSRP
ncbi:unnamed protein product [Linum perenne]